MLKKIISTVLVFVFCTNTFGFGAMVINDSDSEFTSAKKEEIKTLLMSKTDANSESERYMDCVNEKNYLTVLERLKKSNFNIYFETHLLWPNDEKIYKFYDNVRERHEFPDVSKLNPQEKEEVFYYLESMFNPYGYKKSDLLLEAMKLYFSSDKDKQLSDEDFYHLGARIMKSVDKYSFPFIKEKLQNENTNCDDLSDFLLYIHFDKPISDKISNAFDKGYFDEECFKKNESKLPFPIYLPKNEAKINKYIDYRDMVADVPELSQNDEDAILSFNLSVSKKQRILKKTIKNEKVKPEQKKQVILKDMKKSVDKKKQMHNAGQIIGAPFMVMAWTLLMIMPPPIVYPFVFFDTLEEVQSGKTKPDTKIRVAALALASLSPLNWLVMIIASLSF